MQTIRGGISSTLVYAEPANKSAAVRAAPNLPNTNKTAEKEPELSTLARQIAAAVQRAAARAAALSRDELAALAKSIRDRISGESYRFSKQAHDSFVPDTDDPGLLERARRATDFVNGKGANPFKSLGDWELSAIAYDEGGDFTVNERNAACDEISERACAWTREMCRKMEMEQQQTGSTRMSRLEMVAHYKSLPPIQEAEIMGNYEVDLLIEGPDAEIDWPEYETSLVEILAKYAKERDESAPDEPAVDADDLLSEGRS